MSTANSGDTSTALSALLAEGMDPAPYFTMVANGLIARFGMDALDVARESARAIRASGDAEGVELWAEVEAVLTARLHAAATSARIH